MLVRDRSKPKRDYKGRPTEAAGVECPCRPCWHPHDCGHIRPGGVGGWVTRMECATRFNNGCPDPMPEPQHDFGKARVFCRRCGVPRQAPEGGEHGGTQRQRG